MRRMKRLYFVTISLMAIAGFLAPVILAQGADEEVEKKKAAKIIGAEQSENGCVNCHAREVEVWKQTPHFSTFEKRHRSDRANEIQANLGRTGSKKSMKRASDCRQCHYTSQLANNRIRPISGVSCESCHGPGMEWNNIHNKAGGDISASTMRWGEGRQESPDQRAKRLAAAAAKGMIHSEMIYEIATNCFGCHTVPNESLVNKGKHKAGSDFDLVVWSQGQVRHNYLSSDGAPASPTNRPATTAEKRYRYVIGAMVDLEYTLKNLANVKEKGGAFHKAMVERANRVRKKIDAVLNAAPIATLSAALGSVPSPITEATAIGADLPDKVGAATQKFAGESVDLSAIDSQIPTDAKGTPLK